VLFRSNNYTTDKHDICYVHLIVVSATKLVAGYPVPEHLTQTLYSFRLTYGHYDELTTDPGSDIMSVFRDRY